jgi:hypothetical protein
MSVCFKIVTGEEEKKEEGGLTMGAGTGVADVYCIAAIRECELITRVAWSGKLGGLAER